MTRSDRCIRTLSRVCERLAAVNSSVLADLLSDQYVQIPLARAVQDRLILKQAIEELEAVQKDLAATERTEA